VTTTESTAAPIADIAPGDPLQVAERLRDEFRAGAAERDRERKFPYEQCAAFRASGLLGLMVPHEHGGYGGSFAELMKVVIAISAGDSNIGQMYQLHTGGIRLMQEFASPAVWARWLPRFTRELWITNAYSEVGTKSVNDFTTTVTRDGDGWRLNGQKFYCTGSLAGDITFGPCRVAGSDEVRVFFTPTDADGVTIHDDWSGFGQRTTASGTTEFRDVWIPDELCLGSPDTEGGGGASDDLYTQLRVGEMKTADDILLASGIFLFGFTYLYVGIANLAGQAPVGLGWYSAWVAIMATVFGITNIVRFHDPTTGLLWLQWAVLWALFWLVLGLGITRLTPLTGWLTLILSFTTCTIPGYLLLLGEWGRVHTWLVLVVIAATAGTVAPVGMRSLRKPAPAGQAETGIPVSVS
jgi:hypothetical protein